MFQEKLVKSSVSLKILDPGDPRPQGKEYRTSVGPQEGISEGDAKKARRKDMSCGSRPMKDELQDIFTLLKAKEFDLALQFVNYR